MNAKAEILSRREREIAGNLALGKTRKEVSSKLYISQNTAVTHAKNIYAKTESHNLADITRKTIARALGKTIKEVEEAIHKYIIDTTKPLRVVLMASFMAVQVFIIYCDCGDMRRARTVRTVKVKGKRARAKSDTYYG